MTHNQHEVSAGPISSHLRRRKTDRENGDWMRVRWSVVLQVIGYVVAAGVVWNTLTNRITAIETRVDTMRSDITEMKGDVKTLLQRKQ